MSLVILISNALIRIAAILLIMLTTKIEAILFAVAKPVSVSQLKKQLNLSDEIMTEALNDMMKRFNLPDSGIHLLHHEDKIQFITNPDVGAEVAVFLKKEASGPLTRPALETLAVIAYRGPVTKPEIEHVRGVNCSMILRNLLIRGLIEEKNDLERLQPVYRVSEEFLKELGLHSMEELPEFAVYHENEKISELLVSVNETPTDV